ncbi:MAG: TetR/AcrR family transcriptional regulator [Pseudomonadales bacterium]
MSLRQQKKARARRDILTVASTLINTLGYERAKMRDIAAAAEISYQTLYNYFPTKALILQAILTEDVTHTGNEIEALIDRYDGDLLATLDGVTRLRLDVISHHDRHLWRIVIIDLFGEQPEAGSVYQIIAEAAHRVLEALFNTAQVAGDLDAGVDTRLLTDTVFALNQQATTNYVLEPGMPRQTIEDHLRAQYALLIGPYLTDRKPASPAE